MAFIDNSGNTILDAVLTDLGRELLAKSDGSFVITEFGLGDDEINYALYDPSAAGAEATTIQQLPVFEALTNNGIALKHKLINVSETNLLYLPILKLNELHSDTARTTSGYFAVCVDKDTEDRVFGERTAGAAAGSVQGVMGGANPGSWPNYIKIDQGLDTTQISPTQELPGNLKETNYQLKMDNRFGWPIDLDNNAMATTVVDDNQQATFDAFLTDIAAPNALVVEINDTTDSVAQSLSGPRGTTLRLKIRSSLNLQNQPFYFQQLGSTMSSSTFASTGKSNDLYYIDTIISIEGWKMGYKIDIPIRFLKLIAGA